MRTRAELEIDARRLEQQARDTRNEVGAKPLLTFPESSVEVIAGSETGRPETHRMLRHITSIVGQRGPEFRLIEEEFVSDSQGRLVRHYDPIEISTDGGALGILSAGYQRLDEDRLWERVEPVLQRIELDGVTDSEHADAVAEVERCTSEMDLPASARLRVKSDTIDLLEGRLELGDFVSRTVARQECFAMAQRATLSRQITECLEI